MNKPRLLDLFCGEGGAAKGYADAGFEVVGVDLHNQPRYPFEFHQGNALNAIMYLTDLANPPGERFDAIHASPPCQAYSITKHTHKIQHPDLLGPTREALQYLGLPYVIENVVGADMPGAVICCGAALCGRVTDYDMQILYLKRHRQFESNISLVGSGCRCAHLKACQFKIGGVYGGGSRDRKHAENVRHGGYTPAKHIQEQLMGIDWMTQKGLNQAIPPSYGYFIGKQLIESLPSSSAPTPEENRE